MVKINKKLNVEQINNVTIPFRRIRKFKTLMGRENDIFEEILNDYEKDEELCPFCGSIKKIKNFSIKNSGENTIIYDIEYKFETKSCRGLSGHECPRKKLNPNSVEYISIENGVSKEEAMKILKGRNSSPFYRENFSSDEEYKKAQTRDKDYFGDETKYKEFIEKTAHSRTLEGFIEKYGEDEGKKRYEDAQIKKDSSSLKHFIEKYGEDEGKKRYEEKCRKSDSSSLKYFINKFGKREGKRLYEELNERKRYLMTEEYFTDKYGTDIGKEMWKERRKLFSVTKEKFIKKYGEEGESKYEEWKKSTLNSGVSKESLKFFIPLYRSLRKMGFSRDELFFGINGSKEYFIQNDEGFKLYDFAIPHIKLIIEYHGSYWHYNPNYKYPENFKNTLTNQTLNEMKENDDLKRKIAQNRGFEVYEVFDTDDLSKSKEKLLIIIQRKFNEYRKYNKFG